MSVKLKALLKSPWVIIGATIVVTILFFFVMKDNSRMETDLNKYMPAENPAFIYSDKAEQIFGIKDGIIVAVENQDGDRKSVV